MHNGNKEKGIPPIDITQYPAIKNHLDQFYEKLSKRADKGDTPYNLRNCAYMDDFSKPKIMYNDISQRLSFAYVPDDFLCNNTVYFIPYNKYLSYLLHTLNSSLIDWYYKTISVQLGEKAVRMFSIYVLEIPLPIPTEKEISQISKETINEFLYKKYKLTEKEINYIEALS